MRRHRAAVCSIVPPHILRNIAERGDAQQRERAQLTLEQSAHTRGERQALALGAALVVSAGEKRRTIYDARHKRSLPGRLVRGEGDPATHDAAVNEAYDGSGKTYDFFSKVCGRKSIDGRGMRLDSTVHYGVDFDNAQWNGRQMVYGDGDGELFNRFTASLEVIAHELTHGIIQHTASFDYRDEPGALSEHFADVFGVLVRQYSLRQTAARADWLVGAGLFTKKVRGVAVRSMKAPGTAYDDPVLGRDPQPSHMRDFVVTDYDNGGVHVNSGIPNHAFYRVAVALGGKAWEVAGKIWYRALTRKLRGDSRFQDCADATHEAAGELFGRGSEPQNAVAAGWKAVGIGVRRQFETFESPAPGAELPAMFVLPPGM